MRRRKYVTVASFPTRKRRKYVLAAFLRGKSPVSDDLRYQKKHLREGGASVTFVRNSSRRTATTLVAAEIIEKKEIISYFPPKATRKIFPYKKIKYAFVSLISFNKIPQQP